VAKSLARLSNGESKREVSFDADGRSRDRAEWCSEAGLDLLLLEMLAHGKLGLRIRMPVGVCTRAFEIAALGSLCERQRGCVLGNTSILGRDSGAHPCYTNIVSEYSLGREVRVHLFNSVS